MWSGCKLAEEKDEDDEVEVDEEDDDREVEGEELEEEVGKKAAM